MPHRPPEAAVAPRSTMRPRAARAQQPCGIRRPSSPVVAARRRALEGLSRRRSRVRVPSLPLKVLQIGIFCRRSTAGFSRIPRTSRTHPARESPHRPAHSRESPQQDDRPTWPEVVGVRSTSVVFARGSTLRQQPQRASRPDPGWLSSCVVDRGRQPGFLRRGSPPRSPQRAVRSASGHASRKTSAISTLQVEQRSAGISVSAPHWSQ